jgi:ribonucleoside-triphosphate reductase (thioredoxin)
MIDVPDFKDKMAMGGNPCLEQTLHNFEMCTLVETFPHNHQSLDDYKTTLSSAFLYAKTVTLGLSHQPESARVMK